MDNSKVVASVFVVLTVILEGLRPTSGSSSYHSNHHKHDGDRQHTRPGQSSSLRGLKCGAESLQRGSRGRPNTKVALIGGTGKLGRGLAVRLSRTHEVLIGSRDENRALEAAEKLMVLTGRELKGGTNVDVAGACDAAILTIPSLEELAILRQLRDPLKEKLVISPIVPMKMQNGILRYSKPEGSAAEEVASVLSGSRVVAALHNVPALTMEELNHKLGFDVLVACDRKEDYERAALLIRSIEGLRPLYAGPLSMSREIEGITPLLLNAAKLNGLRRLSVKLVN